MSAPNHPLAAKGHWSKFLKACSPSSHGCLLVTTLSGTRDVLPLPSFHVVSRVQLVGEKVVTIKHEAVHGKAFPRKAMVTT